MNIVKEYLEDKTIIRIHDDYIDTNEQKEIKEILISLMVNHFENNDILL